MNNNDILNVLHNSGNDCPLPENLEPSAVEDSLSNVKRKSKKGVVSVCATLTAVCLTVATVFITQSFNNINPYGEIYKTVDSVKKANRVSLFDSMFNYFTGKYTTNELYGLTEDIVYSADTESTSGSLDGAFSETNVQVEGIDEADVAKTDGRYIYSVDDQDIYITNPNNGKPILVSTIETDYIISDLYIHENSLVVIANGMDVSENTSTEDTATDIVSNGTSVIVYDVSDASNPELVSTLGQSGELVSSRKIDNVLYLTTSYSIDEFGKIREDEPITYCPYYSTADEVVCVDAEDISICEKVDSVDYVTVASIDLNNPNKFEDMCSVLGGGEDVYSSFENIYIASYQWTDNGSSTQILRFSIDGTEIEENGSIMVDGNILNQFSMDEHNGYFRVVVENENEKFSDGSVSISISDIATSLYVFDKDLNQVGKTESLAKGERVKSVRFDGDIAYFVTFRQTDPLFTVDISDPQNPKVLSELKIPGFSEYLHVMSEDLLLGFGREADEMTGITEGLKLSMFDTSDKSDVTEITTKHFGTDEEYSEAEYNHKAVYVDEENFIVGIPYWSYDEYGTVFYSLFKYDVQSEEFILIETIEESLNSLDYYKYKCYTRGMRIGDSFYVVTNDAVFAYDYISLEKTGNVNF